MNKKTATSKTLANRKKMAEEKNQMLNLRNKLKSLKKKF